MTRAAAMAYGASVSLSLCLSLSSGRGDLGSCTRRGEEAGQQRERRDPRVEEH